MSGVKQYDYIVVGCGGIGSATVYWLSKRAGKRVLGLEQFKLGHDNGGSQDHSRIIRLAYNACEYIPLARGTYEAWGEAERESGVQLVYKTGGLDIAKKGTPGHAVVEIFARAMTEQNVDFERYEGESIKKKYPQFAATPQWTTLYQKDAGLVDAAMGNSVHIQLAQFVKQGNLTKVYTSQGDFLCRKVILTAGAWMNDVLSSVGVKIPLTVTQEQVTYFGTPHMKEFTKDRCPTFILHTGQKAEPYFLPLHGNTGFKIGLDVGGPVVTAQTRNFVPDKKRQEIERNYVAELVPRAVGPILYTKTCLYTMTPDRNFVIDTCKKTGHPDVIFCCGAGHAYKFAAVLGKILSQLAIDERTTFDISCFNMERPAIIDPNYPVSFQLGVDVDDNMTSKL
eukprot:XP_011674417.1 PREDICTED: peroxisomal sarcosine oxidase [Strongylocentrotus purpuratus]